MTYTYAILEVSQGAYAEIRELLREAGYAGQFIDRRRGDAEVIDMHGIALQAKQVDLTSLRD